MTNPFLKKTNKEWHVSKFKFASFQNLTPIIETHLLFIPCSAFCTVSLQTPLRLYRLSWIQKNLWIESGNSFDFGYNLHYCIVKEISKFHKMRIEKKRLLVTIIVSLIDYRSSWILEFYYWIYGGFKGGSPQFHTVRYIGNNQWVVNQMQGLGIQYVSGFRQDCKWFWDFPTDVFNVLFPC